jgi:hypothetical protein
MGINTAIHYLLRSYCACFAYTVASLFVLVMQMRRREEQHRISKS